MDTKELALKAGKILSDRKAEDILLIDIGERSGFADYFVIATGTSERQLENLIDYVEDGLAEDGVLVKNIEGRKNSGWVLMDFGDVIVNLFSPEMRTKYNIEKVWADCDKIEIED